MFYKCIESPSCGVEALKCVVCMGDWCVEVNNLTVIVDGLELPGHGAAHCHSTKMRRGWKRQGTCGSRSREAGEYVAIEMLRPKLRDEELAGWRSREEPLDNALDVANILGSVWSINKQCAELSKFRSTQLNWPHLVGAALSCIDQSPAL